MALSPFFLLFSLQLLIPIILTNGSESTFNFTEPTIRSIQTAFELSTLTSRQLLQHYIHQTRTLNPTLKAVIELNPDALDQADRADLERRTRPGPFGGLHGIPVLLKDVIATRDRLNTTAGSLALLGSVVARDSGVVEKLREGGAIIFGKASMSEWLNFRTHSAPSGWSARGGQSRVKPWLRYCSGGQHGGGISLASETDGSIRCPSASTSVVGIKPTVGLTSWAGVIPISTRMDTIGPICRTVVDAVEVLEAIVGFDERDAEATRDAASKYIPQGGYKQFLKVEELKGKKIGILRKGFFDFPSAEKEAFEEHFRGAILIDDLEIANISEILDHNQNGEQVAMLAEFKMNLNAYLSELVYSPVRSLQDIIDFNIKHTVEERTVELGQSTLLAAQNTSGLGPLEQKAITKVAQLSKDGLERLVMEERLDAVVTPNADATSIFAIGGYPGISVPAGFGKLGHPFGIFFGGLKGWEPKLIEIAYAFEQATQVRKPPPFLYENYV